MELRLGGLLEPDRYRQLLRRWWRWLLLGTLAGLVVGLLFSAPTDTVYRTSTFLLINTVQTPGSPDPDDLGVNQRLAASYSQLLRSQPMLEETIRDLALPLTATELSGRVVARPVAGTQYLTLTVVDADPARAASIANQLALVLIRRTQDQRAANMRPVEQRIAGELDELRQRITDTASRLTQLRAAPAVTGDTVAEIVRLENELSLHRGAYLDLLGERRRIELEQAQASSAISVAVPADIPAQPVPRATAYNILRFGLIGLLLVIGLAVVVEFLDDRFRAPEDLRRRFDLAPLGALPLVPGGRAGSAAGALLTSGLLTEPLRRLRTNLGFATGDGPIAVCLCGGLPGAGASTVAAQLALAEARAGKRVILVDADLREPALGRFFGLDDGEGLSTHLAQASAHAHPLPPPLQDGPLGIKILPSGPVPPNPTELLSLRRMGELVDELRAQADIVLLDAAPLLPFADTLALQRAVDGTVIVLDAGRTGSRTLDRILVALRQAPRKVLGVVLNKDSRHSGVYERGTRPAAEQDDGDLGTWREGRATGPARFPTGTTLPGIRPEPAESLVRAGRDR